MTTHFYFIEVRNRNADFGDSTYVKLEVDARWLWNFLRLNTFFFEPILHQLDREQDFVWSQAEKRKLFAAIFTITSQKKKSGLSARGENLARSLKTREKIEKKRFGVRISVLLAFLCFQFKAKAENNAINKMETRAAAPAEPLSALMFSLSKTTPWLLFTRTEVDLMESLMENKMKICFIG